MGLLHFDGVAFPVITLGINVIGSFCIMFFTGLFSKAVPASEHWVLFVRVGLCGGFTTFSTFSAETLALIEQGDLTLGVIYAAASCILCVIAAFLGELAALTLTK